MGLSIYLDFEATGLSRWNDRITQIGALAARSGVMEPIGKFESFVFTEKKISAKASEVTGIYNEDLKGAPIVAVVLQQFFTWIQSVRIDLEEVTLIAYNGINYDFPMLYCEMLRSEMNIDRQLKASGIMSLVDPLIWARTSIENMLLLRKKSGNCSFCLGDVHRALTGCAIKNAHSALADTEALHRVCVHSAFSGLEQVTSDDHCCLGAATYLIEFMEKKRCLESGVKQNRKNKILSLVDMKTRKRKRVSSISIPVFVPEVPEVPEVPDVPDVPDVPELPELPELPDVFNIIDL